MAALGVQLPVVEKILHHLSGSFGGVAGIYQRQFVDEMAAALDLWGQHVSTLAPAPGPEAEPRKMRTAIRQGARL